MHDALWKVAIASVPNEEIVRIVNGLGITIDGFGKRRVNKSNIKTARKLIESKLKTPKGLLKLHQFYQLALEKSEPLQAALKESSDELWTKISTSDWDCVPLWTLLVDGSEESIEKVQDLIARLQAKDEPLQSEQTQTVAVQERESISPEGTSEAIDEQIHNLEIELSEYKRQLRKAKHELDTQVKKFERNLKTAREQIESLKQQNQHLKKENKELQDTISKRDEVIATLQGALESTKQTLQVKSKALFDENQSLQKEIDELRTLSMITVNNSQTNGQNVEPSSPTQSTDQIAVIGDAPSAVIPTGSKYPIVLFGSTDVAKFLNLYDDSAWSEVWLLKYSVNRQNRSKLQRKIPTDKLKVFESLLDFQNHIS